MTFILEAVFTVFYVIPAVISCLGTLLEAAVRRGHVETVFEGAVPLTAKMAMQRSLVPGWNMFVALKYLYRYVPETFRRNR